MKIKYRVQYEAGFATSYKEFDTSEEAWKFDSEANIGRVGKCISIIVYPENPVEFLCAVEILQRLKETT